MPHQVVYVRGELERAGEREGGREGGRKGGREGGGGEGESVTYCFGSAMVRCLQVVMVTPPSLALLPPLVMLK